MHLRLTRKHSRTEKKTPRMTPMMTPTILRDDRWVLLLLPLLLLSVLSVLSTDTGIVAFTSLVPVFPARSWYVPADRLHMLVCCRAVLLELAQDHPKFDSVM